MKKKFIQGISLMILCAVLNTCAVFFNKLSTEIFSFTVKGLIFNYWLILGFIFLISSFIILKKAFSKGEMSLLYPLLSFSYIGSLIVGKVIWNEEITLYKILGILFIIIGVIILSIQNAKTDREGVEVE